MAARIETPENLNTFEVMQVMDYMERTYPKVHYHVRSGNGCVWVYWGNTVPMNLYFLFRDSQIADIQVD